MTHSISNLTPPTTRSKLRDLYGFLTKNNEKNNISFPPKIRWDLNLCVIPSLIKVQKPHLMKPNLDPSPSVRPTDKPPPTPKKKWAVPHRCWSWFHLTILPDFRSKNHPCRLEEEIRLKVFFNLPMRWHSGIFDSDTVNKNMSKYRLPFFTHDFCSNSNHGSVGTLQQFRLAHCLCGTFPPTSDRVFEFMCR